MFIITIRTDKPEAELGLYDGKDRIDYLTWQAHRQLAETLHSNIAELLTRNGMTLDAMGAMACYQGPGSFTGLRIGLSVANAMAYSLRVPIVGATGKEWLAAVMQKVADGTDEKTVMPEYGAQAHITRPRQ